MQRQAAFFDIDGTIYRDCLMVEHFKTIMDLKIVDDPIKYAEIEKLLRDWYKRQIDYEKYLELICESYVLTLKKISRSDAEFAANRMIRRKAGRVYKFTRSMINRHKEMDHKVIFISGSPDFLVKRMAEIYDADDYEGSKYIYDEEKFTGNIKPMWDSKSKNQAVDKFSEKYDLDLASSYAYGDTNGDISMMKKVGHPIAMNPSRELIDAIKADSNLKLKARIVIERKDTVYITEPKQATLMDIQ